VTDKLKIVSINVNGIRSALRKGFAEKMKEIDPDVICIQETKAQIAKLKPSEFSIDGYHFISTCAEKPGYSGVGIYSKQKPSHIETSIGLPWADAEGRLIQCQIHGTTIASIYLPSGTSGPHRQKLKYDMMTHFEKILQSNLSKPIIYCGDFNIAHTSLDIKRDKANENNSGYLPEERNWIRSILNLGYIDTFRELHPTKEQYTWWTYRAGARQKNIGWRIDYQLASPCIKDKLIDAYVISEPVLSDHAILVHSYVLQK
jgi:exodeoxyribonuclease-3